MVYGVLTIASWVKPPSIWSTLGLQLIGCPTEIAKLIIEGEADYVLALKGNQGTLGTPP